MVRKGNQQRNGLDRNSSNHKTSISESGVGSLKEKKERQKAREGKVVDGEELPNGTQPNSSLAETNRTKYVRDEKRSNKKSGNFPSKAKPVVDRVSDLAQPVSVSSNSRDPVADESSLNTPDLREQNETSPGSNHSLKSPKRSPGSLQHGLPVKDVMEASQSSDAVAGRSLRASALSILKVASTWLERQKPFFTTLTTIVVDACNNVRHKTEQATTIIVDACNYVGLKTKQAYPIVWEWLVYFGKLMMLISVVWLDCSIRGLDSFIRMGTTSFFTVIWCSILSLIAMIGFSKFLMIMAIAALVAVFVGFTLAILVIVIFAIMFLWLYGSFWTTGLVIVVGGSAFALHLERFALLVTTIYSVYCAKTYVGWLGLLLGLNLSFISSDCLIYFLNRRRPSRPPEQMDGSHGQSDFFNGEPSHASPFETAAGRSTDRSPGVPSTSGDDVELTSEDEVVRLLNCTDHYSALGFSRYENVDISLLKREYRKKAMLVHPDKNMGNEKAAEAFKKLQNAYEVLLDSLKRKAYDDELRREELLNCFRRLQNISQKNGRHGLFSSGFTHYEAETEDTRGDSRRRITCKKCGNFHIWVYTNKSKSQARWCQDCKDFHPAKDGDGWVEQSLHPFFFGLLQKVEAPSAYVCAESRIYNATEWFICQGMNCPANTHKPSFHVNTNVTSKHSSTKGTSWGQRASGMPTSNMEENMTEEEFYEWLQNAVQLGFFEANGGSPSTESPSPSTGNCSKGGGSSSSKRKKKGKKQW